MAVGGDAIAQGASILVLQAVDPIVQTARRGEALNSDQPGW